MSLDIYFIDGEEETTCHCCGATKMEPNTVGDHNITHNLGTMAGKAGIYHALWRPDENGITKASQITPILKEGIKKMEKDPAFFKQFDAANGWGTYEHFLPWLYRVLETCENYPNADVRVSR